MLATISEKTNLSDWSNIGLLIITFVSIFAPVVVSIINNIHDSKVRKMEINSKIKQDVLYQFSKTIVKEFNPEYVNSDFRQALNLLNIYFNVDNHLVKKIITTKYENINDFQNDVTALMKKLSTQVKYK